MVAKLGVAHQGGRLFWGGVKAFSDGSLGSRTALMHQPYTDDTSSSGMRATPLPELRSLVQKADAAGLQVSECIDGHAVSVQCSKEEAALGSNA